MYDFNTMKGKVESCLIRNSTANQKQYSFMPEKLHLVKVPKKKVVLSHRNCVFAHVTTGEWSFEEPTTKLFIGDLGLILKVISFDT